MLLERGGDLSRALHDCPRQDAGFSPLTLAWTLRSLLLERLAKALAWPTERIQRVVAFQQTLTDELLKQARPEQ